MLARRQPDNSSLYPDTSFAVMSTWEELPSEESKQYDYLPKDTYDLDIEALRLVARRSDGRLVFRKVRKVSP